MKQVIKLLSLVLIALQFASCKPNAVATPDETSKIKLTSKNWRITERRKEYYENGVLNNDPTYSGPITLTDEADNIYTFKTDNTVSMDQGAIWINGSSAQVLNGTWSFVTANNLQYLRITGLELALGTYNDFEILSLTNTELKLMLTLEFSIAGKAIVQKEFIKYN